jgi:hypothetical protein
MTIQIRRQSAADVPTLEGHDSLFADETGQPKLKAPGGAVTAFGNEGAPVTLDEQVSAPAAEANKVKLYAKEISGFSQPFFRGDDGVEVQLGVPVPARFFDGAESFTIEDTLPASPGTVAFNTGIVPSLFPNGLLTISIESQSVVALGQVDMGSVVTTLLWDTTPPVSDPNFTSNHFNGSVIIGMPTAILFGALAGTPEPFTLNASGELVLTLAGVGKLTARLLLKVTVAPSQALGFDPLP